MDFSNEDFDNDELEHYENKKPIYIDINLIGKITNSNIIENICLLEIELQDGKINFVNGIFCYIPSKEMKVFITNNHVIDQKYLDNKTEIKYIIENSNNIKEKRIMSLNKKRFITTNKELDVTIIEILDEDNINSFFEVDEKFIQNKELKNEEIFSLFILKEKEAQIFLGKILESSENFFAINANVDAIPSGAPIVTIDGMKIIGIHKGCSSTLDKNEKQNIGVILDKIIEIIPKSNCSLNTNVIKCIYYIDYKDTIKDVKIYDNSHNIGDKINNIIIYGDKDEDEKNKENIKNGKYRFNNKGKYLFCYHLDNTADDLSNMFYDCSSLAKVFISSFPENKITNLSHMFEGCETLTKIYFSFSFNTENVQDMSSMFKDCDSLKSINLSYFNTKNVDDMSNMFKSCCKLEQLDLSSFNTQNVESMSCMFDGCRKLKNINLSSFNTEKVKIMQNMFDDCRSLQKIDLSGFNIANVYTMNNMFKSCSSLKELDLSSFQKNKFAILMDMFADCPYLKLIQCNDEKIKEEFEKTKF